MSPDTVTFLLGLLNQLTLGTGAPDFEQTALAVIKARRELTTFLPDLTPGSVISLSDPSPHDNRSTMD